ncbi:hypothetical protein Tco_1164085 [Tanacetum coccineum]
MATFRGIRLLKRHNKYKSNYLAKVWKVGWTYGDQVLDTAYWGYFCGVGTTLDIFQNIILIPYLEYGILILFEYGVLIFIPLWSLVSAGTDTPYLP